MLTAAEAWCWAARMYDREADARYYAWPRTNEDMAEGDKLADKGSALYARAKGLDPSEDLWDRAMGKWDDPGPR